MTSMHLICIFIIFFWTAKMRINLYIKLIKCIMSIMSMHMHGRIKYFARKTYLLKHGPVSVRAKASDNIRKNKKFVGKFCAIVAVKEVSFPVSLETAEDLLIKIAFLYLMRVPTQRQPPACLGTPTGDTAPQ